jgi:hypothetical protein
LVSPLVSSAQPATNAAAKAAARTLLNLATFPLLY